MDAHKDRGSVDSSEPADFQFTPVHEVPALPSCGKTLQRPHLYKATQ